jgi:hypothetical protein
MQTESISRPMRANVAGFAIPLTVTQNSDRHHVPSSTTVLIESAVVATHVPLPWTYQRRYVSVCH